MSIITTILLVLGGLILCGIGAGALVLVMGRRLFLSWKKPYKRASDSFSKLSGVSATFLREFSQQPLLYQWLYKEGTREPAALTALFSAADERGKELIFASLPKQQQKQLHVAVKQKKKFVQQDADRAREAIERYMDEEYRQSSRRLGLSFYKLYFHDEYGAVLQTIQDYKQGVSPELQETIEEIVASVLHTIPYYKERRMYEQQHKFEVLLTRDIPEMLILISNLPPMQRRSKEQELAAFLQAFQQELNSVNAALEHDLQVKMRATKEKFKTN